MTLVHRDVLFHAAEHAEFRLDADAFRVRPVHHALGDRHVLLERFVRRVDHDRTVEAAGYTIVTSLFIAVIEMYGENSFREDITSRTDNGFEHTFIRIFTSAFGDLDDEGGFRVDASTEEAHGLLGVVNII